MKSTIFKGCWSTSFYFYLKLWIITLSIIILLLITLYCHGYDNHIAVPFPPLIPLPHLVLSLSPHSFRFSIQLLILNGLQFHHLRCHSLLPSLSRLISHWIFHPTSSITTLLPIVITTHSVLEESLVSEDRVGSQWEK